MIQYSQFYQMFGNRTPSKVENPRIFNLSQFDLPKQNAIHYLPSTSDDVGPTQNNPLFKGVKQQIPVYSYQDIVTRLGVMNIKTYNAREALRVHFKQNRKLKNELDLAKVNPNMLVPLVLNYGVCDKRYKYLGDEKRIPYYKSMNMLNTLIAGWVDLYNKKKEFYHQFVFINVPKLHEIPTIQKMKVACQQTNLDFFKTFDSLEKLFIFEMWKYLSVQREKSILKNMPKPLLEKINVVMTCNNVFTVFRLSDLDNWRRSEENVTGVFEPIILGKAFMKMLVKMNAASQDKTLVELTEEEVIQENKNKQNTVGAENETELEKSIEDDLDQTDEQVVSDSDDPGLEVDEGEEESEEKPVQEQTVKPSFNKNDYEDITNQIVSDNELTLGNGEIDFSDDLKLSRVVNVSDEQEEVFDDDSIYRVKMDVTDALNLKNYPIEKVPTLMSRPTEVKDIDDKCREALNDIAKQQNMTVSKYNGLNKRIGGYRNQVLSKEDGNGKTLGDMVNVNLDDLRITEEDAEVSTLNIMDRKYITEFMERDVVSMLTSIQANGVLVQDIKRQDHGNISGEYSVYSMKIIPVEGEPSTIRVKLPRISADGRFKVNGNEYFMRKQRRDLPIRKINSNTVALSTYFGKTFVRRIETRNHNYEKWLIGKIREAAFDKNNQNVLETRTADLFDNLVKYPIVFSLLSKHFRTIKTKDAFIYLDRKHAFERFGFDIVNYVEKLERTEQFDNLTFCGLYQEKYALAVDENNEFYKVSKESVTHLGTIEDLCGLNQLDGPAEAVAVDVMGVSIPVGIVLCYKMGLTALLAALKPKHYRTIKTGARPNLESHEYAIKFNDFTLILSKKDRQTTLILSGLSRIKELSKYSIFLMNTKELYFSILESIKIPGRYTKEIDLYYRMFVDPISERILIDMGEPTDYGGLLIRAVEMLLTLEHKDEVDMSEQRIAGYERITGEVYKHLVHALREHNRHGIKANYPIELNPEAVWTSVMTDTSKQIVDCLNPVQDLKQSEMTSFSGNGGRSRQSMVVRTRAHHKTAIGIISEATTDNADAGNTTYLSANPKFKSIYGIPQNSGTSKLHTDSKPDNVLSTNAMLQPCVDCDDPKRIVFSGTQVKHQLASQRNHILPVRTGYDSKLVARSADIFSAVCDYDGTVTELNDYAITITYSNGLKRQVEIGRRYGNSGGFSTAHDVVTDLKLGQKVKKGDAIAYNKDFFTQDPMNPGGLAYKSASLIRVALIEHPYTFEDSAAITKKVGDASVVKVVTKKHVVVNFEQNIHRLAKPGTQVQIDEPLCFIEDSLTEDASLFDETSIDLLRNISQNAPKCKVNGVVDKVEILYNGDVEDMSESLQKLVHITDSKLVALQKALGKKPFTGEVDETFRVDGTPMAMDTAVIIFTISSEQGIASGDKIVLGNQLKATIGHVFDDAPRLDNNGEFGEEIDCLFGCNSVFNRIVNSPFMIGMASTLLVEMSKKLGKLYFNEK